MDNRISVNLQKQYSLFRFCLFILKENKNNYFYPKETSISEFI